jgi:AICAR transformylase/IMP cyclohydrolase PurH
VVERKTRRFVFAIDGNDCGAVVQEADMYALGMPFGRVVAVLMLKGKTQGFIEMEDIAAATNLVNCYQAAPPVIRYVRP